MNLKKLFLVFGVSFFLLLGIMDQSLQAAAPPIPARIGGTVSRDGLQLTQVSDTGYTFKVTKLNGTDYLDFNNNPAQDTDGLNASYWYLIDIPIYDATEQPGGANPGDTAVIHVYKNGTQLTVTSPPSGQFPVGNSGSVNQIDLAVTIEADLNVSAIPTTVDEGDTITLTISNGTAPFTVTASPADAVSGLPTEATSETTVTATAGTVTTYTTVTFTVTDSSDPVETATATVTVSPVGGPVEPPIEPTQKELTTDEAKQAAPVDLGSAAVGGDKMGLAVNFPAYTEAVDIYVALQLPDGSLFVLDSDGSLTLDLVAYAIGVTGASTATIFEDFTVCTPFGTPAVPEGTWTVYWVIAPTNGGDISAIDWTLDPYELGWYTFEVSCD